MDIFTILLLIVGYLIMSVITAIAYAYCDSTTMIGESSGMMYYLGIFWPIFVPVGVLYLTLGYGSRWLYQKFLR